jgi:alkyl sulfatase BDS1-like metallo-beta-lactamase superfamily hydrolase
MKGCGQALGLVLALLLCAGCGDDSRPSASGDAAPLAQRVAVAEGQGERADALDDFGDDLSDAVELAPGVYQARGKANAHLVYTSEGSVVFDTGLVTEAGDHAEKLRRAAPGPVKVLIASHAHADHYSGFGEWVDDGVDVVAHADFPETQRYLTELVPFLMRRNRIFYPNDVPEVPFGLGDSLIQRFYPQLEPTILVDDLYAFELGGVQFEVIATPGAEGSDSVSLWLPQKMILFTGDFYGPIFPMWPNLDTPRGEKMRFTMPYIESLDRVIALEPEMLVPSHFEPVVGKETIREGLQRMRDAVAYVHEAVIDGMNDGKSLEELRREIELPPELQLSEAHGTVDWGVRAIWESYVGWWRDETVTEMYPVPVRDVYADLAELAGADALTRRAREHTAKGELTKAMHLIEIALAADPERIDTLRAELEVLQAMLDRSGGVNHHEVTLLKREIARVREKQSD